MATKTNPLSKCKSMYAKVLLTSLLTLWSSQNIYAYDVEVDGIYYNLYQDNHTAGVTYYYTYEINVESYKGSVRIPQYITFDGTVYEVKFIDDLAFSNSQEMTDITMPNSIQSIGANAFYSCVNLSKISIPDSVISIGDNAFSNCRNLTSIKIPKSVTTIGKGILSGCI